MKLSFQATIDNLEDLAKRFLILSNLKRLRLLFLLHKLNKPLSSADIHREAKKEKIYSNRETTYRALEDLVKSKLISKSYDEGKKELVYCAKDENHS